MVEVGRIKVLPIKFSTSTRPTPPITHHVCLDLDSVLSSSTSTTSTPMTADSELAVARIAIDRGGTFTDAICSRKGHDDIVLKV
jgi:hypothetical protein